MNSQNKIFLSLIFFIVITISAQVFAQDTAKPDSSKHEMKKMGCCKDKSTSEKSIDCKKRKETTTVSLINVGEADKNKDGKVYQCSMCADQLADEPGKCSKCGMNLKEAALEEAKKNLRQNGFKVK